MITSINNDQPTRSIIVGDFNTKLLKWFPSDKGNKNGQDMDNLTATSSYSQMSGQPMDIIKTGWHV